MSRLETPRDVAAERAVLGSLLAAPDTIGDVVDLLAAEDFHHDAHRVAFRAILEQAGEGARPDLPLLVAYLRETGRLDDAGGASGVSSLADDLPDPSNIKHYAARVLEASRRRRLLQLAAKLVGQAQEPGRDVDELLEVAGGELAAIAAGRGDQTACEAIAAAEAVVWRALQRDKGDTKPPITLGIGPLDEALGGLRGGQLLVVAARTSVGKTAFALQVAARAAVAHKRSVVYASYEMSRDELAERMLAQLSGVSVGRIRRGDFNGVRWRDVGGDLPLVEAAREQLRGGKLQLVDGGAATPAALRSRCRTRQLRQDLDLLVVDYLQLMRSGQRHSNRVEEVSAISRALKELARDLDVPVVALSQLNREPERRGGVETASAARRSKSEPRLSDLRESGSIENDADAVVLLHRRLEGEAWEVRVAMAILAKHRCGPTGRFALRFDPTRVCFQEGVNDA